MKKIILIISILITGFAINVNAQTPQVTDTLAYLQSIVYNKSAFIGKPFSVLMDSLQIQIKFFSPFAGISYDKSQETSTSFSFYFPQTADEIYLTYPSLEIYWHSPLNAEQSNLLYNEYNGGGWAPPVAAFYSTGIIADINIQE